MSEFYNVNLRCKCGKMQAVTMTSSEFDIFVENSEDGNVTCPDCVNSYLMHKARKEKEAE